MGNLAFGEDAFADPGYRLAFGYTLISVIVLSKLTAVRFTSSRAKMGRFASPWWLGALAWFAAAVIVTLNVKLLIDFAFG